MYILSEICFCYTLTVYIIYEYTMTQYFGRIFILSRSHCLYDWFDNAD